MRDRLKSTAGWLFVLAFLGLPNCILDSTGTGVLEHFQPGEQPHNSAIFCDIEDVNAPRHCASPAELSSLSVSHAAVDLVLGNASNVALDFSHASIAAQGCSPGQPVVITFKGPFPAGTEACLNCGQAIGSDANYPSVDAACVDKCKDVNPGSDAFCSSGGHAHASTNANSCFAGACSDEGAPVAFDDPRLKSEPVVWDLPPGGDVSTFGTDSNGLQRDAATTLPLPGAFDKGAASTQTITKGDGYVVFTATEIDTARVCGLSTGSSDSDQTDQDIDFGFRLSAGGHVLISENGSLVVPPDANPNFWFADYVSGDRFRITVSDNQDGTANIEYFLIPSSCPKESCTGTKLRPADGDPPITASYPFRVDASLRQQSAALTDVRIVRIK